MESFLRAFGRTPKKVEKKEDSKVESSKISNIPDNSNMFEDDIFSDLVINNPSQEKTVKSRHLSEIQDLIVTRGDSQGSSMSLIDRATDFSEMQDLIVTSGDSQGSLKSLTDRTTDFRPSEMQDLIVTRADIARGPISFTDRTANLSEMHDLIDSSGDSKGRSISLTARPRATRSTPSTTRQTNIKRTKKRRSVKPGFGNVEKVNGFNSQTPSVSMNEEKTESSEETCSLTSEASSFTSEKDVQDNFSLHQVESSNEYLDGGTQISCDLIQSSRDNSAIRIGSLEEKYMSETIRENLGIMENLFTIDEKHNNPTSSNVIYIESGSGSKESKAGLDSLSSVIFSQTQIENNIIHSVKDVIVEPCKLEHRFGLPDAGTEKDYMEMNLDHTHKEVEISEIVHHINASNLENTTQLSSGAEGTKLGLEQEVTLSVLLAENQLESTNVTGNKENENLENEESSDIESSDNCIMNIDISENEMAILNLEVLRSREEELREAVLSCVNVQNYLIDQWKCEHLDSNQVELKICELQQSQFKFESDEDYDKAAEIDQEITKLVARCDRYKYEHPLSDQKFLDLLRSYEDVCVRQKTERNAMLTECASLLNILSVKNSNSDKCLIKRLDEKALHLKEKRLKIERDLSHTLLDKEHAMKNEVILSEQVNMQTKELLDQKGELLEKQEAVQAHIEKLLMKLNQLQKEDAELTISIGRIDGKIQDITNEFQPRVDKVMGDKQIADEEECKLNKELEKLLNEEEEIELEKRSISNQKEKNEESISDVKSHILDIEQAKMDLEKEVFSFHDLLDLSCLELDDNSGLKNCKVHLEDLGFKLKDITNKVIVNEGEENRMQRLLKDIEAQLAELQRLKQVHVKDRKYREAKQNSDEIKSLMIEGEQISCTAIQLNESIKLQKVEIESLKLEVDAARSKLKDEELAHNEEIVKKLAMMNVRIEEVLNSNHIWAEGILRLQLWNNNNIIYNLSEKHR